MNDLLQIADALKQQKEICIHYHEKPDGDAVGSAYALALALRQFGIRTACVSPSPVPARYLRWTDAVENDSLESPCHVAVDSASLGRIDRSENLQVEICIDHHNQDKKPFPARLRYVRKEAASCAQLVFQLIQTLGAEITPQIADFLYIGIVTDTDCFCLPTTDAEVFAAAAALAECGADVGNIGHQIFRKKSPARLEMERRVRNACEVTAEGRILSCVLREKDYEEAGISDNDLEGLNLIPAERIGPEIYVIIRETGGNHCRVSVRTEGAYDAAEICAHFGGGGHSDAAGCSLEGPGDEVRRTVASYCESVLR